MKNCKFCDHRDLPILPLRLAYAPKYRADGTPQIVADKIVTPFLEESAPEAGKLYKPSTQAGQYILRTITEGYIFAWNETTNSWLVFAATWDGKFKKVAVPGKNAKQWEEAPEFSCETGTHMCLASLISIPKSTGKVWVGYSRVMWTQEIRAKIKDNVNGVRDHLMIPLNIPALMDGAPLDPKHGFRVEESGESIIKYVPEYNPRFDWAWQVEHIFQYTHTQPLREEGIAALLRMGEAKPTGEAMYKINAKGGIALALKDPVGILQDINGARNQIISSYATYFAQAQTVREHIIANLIVENRENMEKTPEGADRWRKKFAPRIDEAKVNERIRAYRKRVDEKIKAIELLAQDWKYWCTHQDLWDAWSCYSDQYARTLLDLSDDMAVAIEGAGSQKVEQAVLEEQLSALIKDPDGKYRALLLAIIGDAEFLKFMKTNAGIATEFANSQKNAAQGQGNTGAAGKEKTKKQENNDASGKLGTVGQLNVNRQTVDIVRDLYEKFSAWRLTHAFATAQNVNVGAAVVGQTLHAAIMRLVAQKKAEARYLSHCFAFATALRVKVELLVQSYEFTTKQWIFDIHSTMWSHKGEKLEVGKLVKGIAESTRSSKAGNLATQIDEISVSPVLASNPFEHTIPVKSVFIEVVGTINEQVASITKKTPISKTQKKIMKNTETGLYQKQAHWLKSATGQLGVLGMFLTMDNLLSNVADYFGRRNQGYNDVDELKGMEGMISAAFGMLAVTMELTSFIKEKGVKPALNKLAEYTDAAIAKKALNKTSEKKLAQLMKYAAGQKTRFGPELFKAVFASSTSRFVGGAFAIGFSTADAYYLIKKGNEISDKGGNPLLYYTSSGLMFGSGVLSGIASLVGAAAIIKGSGVLATGTVGSMAAMTASPVTLNILRSIVALSRPFAFLGPWGWTALALISLGAAIYAWVEAEDDEPTALELWMSRCCFGKELEGTGADRKRFDDMEEELRAYYQALFALVVKFKWNILWLRNDSVEMEVKLPYYNSSTSEYCYSLYLENIDPKKGSPLVIDQKPSERSRDPDLRPRKPVLAEWRAAPAVKVEPPIKGLFPDGATMSFNYTPGMLTISAKFKVNEAIFQKAVLKLEYWPDPQEMPDVKITPKEGNNAVKTGTF